MGHKLLERNKYFKSSDQYYAVFNNVKGLVENASVYLNGYKVGTVNRIEFDKQKMNRIIVRISLEEKLELKKNTVLLLKSGSLISGTKDIDLIPGDGEGYHQSGDTLLSSIQVEITDYLDPIRAKIESLVMAVDTVMVSLADLMDNQTRNNLKGTIANLNSATASLKTALQPSGSLSKSLDNIDQLTAKLKESNADISAILKNFAAVSDTLKQAELKSLIVNASETFAKTTELFAMINSGEGTAGQLIKNDSVYNNLNSALSSLDSLLIDLREHPKRYVHLSVFGKKEK